MDRGQAAVDHRGVVRRASLLVLATGFGDPFDSLDGGRWSVGDHQLGRSRLDPASIAVAGGALELRHPAATLVDRGDVTS